MQAVSPGLELVSCQFPMIITISLQVPPLLISFGEFKKYQDYSCIYQNRHEQLMKNWFSTKIVLLALKTLIPVSFSLVKPSLKLFFGALHVLKSCLLLSNFSISKTNKNSMELGGWVSRGGDTLAQPCFYQISADLSRLLNITPLLYNLLSCVHAFI